MLRKPVLCAVLWHLVAVVALSEPPTGSITIGPVDSGAQYATLTEALLDTSSNVFFVYSGTYGGQHFINRTGITIYGQTVNELDYTANTVTFANSRASSDAGSNDAGATIRISSSANDTLLYNLNIANTLGPFGQAVALSVQAFGNFACYACKLSGYQDTLLANQGYQFYGKSFIEGAVDFIFGSRASIWIHDSIISTNGGGYVTASGRNNDDTNWYVIDHSTVTGTGHTYLGRPWRSYARVVFQFTYLDSIVDAKGWSEWGSTNPQTENVVYCEHNNTGPSAWNAARASFATLMTEPLTIEAILKSTDWIDSRFILPADP